MRNERATISGVKLHTLPNQVAAHLLRQIVNGELRDGQIPSETEITGQFGVSRVVARETLKILASLDVVDIAQGRRVVLRPQAEWDYLSPVLVEWLPPDEVDRLLHELQEMRLLLEPELAAKAAASLDDATEARLREELNRMANNEDNPESYLEADYEFHMEICRAAHNRLLDRVMYSCRWLQATGRRVTNQEPGGLRRATEAHQSIFDALKARDPQASREAMRLHLAYNVFAPTDRP